MVIFRALNYRNFRLFFIGQGISLVGTWMQQIAMIWLVYRLTNSPLVLGVVAFSSQIPTFLLTPFAGVLADRLERRRILLVTQTLAMIQAFILAHLTLNGTIAVWHILALGLMLGCINSFDIPTRQSFIIEMVEKKEILGNAIALNSFMFNFARLVGPSLAGILIALIGEGLCFFINGISFLAVIISLLLMRISAQSGKPRESHILEELKEGVAYTFSHESIRYILLLLALISLTGMSYVVLMPVVAKEVLHGGPETLGFLMAAVGIGALLGTVYLASRRDILLLKKITTVSAGVFGICLVLFSFSYILWISFAILLFTGFSFMVQTAASNMVVQTIVDDDKRGRVMSFYTMSFMGMAPLGSLVAGTLASKIGVSGTIAISGASCILASLVFSKR